jgi:hypothetical protein
VLSDLSRLGVVNILRHTCILCTLFTSFVFLGFFISAQITRALSTDISLNFFIYKFFFVFTANLVKVIATQPAKNSSSAVFRAFLRVK